MRDRVGAWGVFTALALFLLPRVGLALGVGDEAPSLSAQTWINGEPALDGKVRLVEFWTFGCWNCRNVEPHVKRWHDRYAERGLVVVGVHSPEFAAERDIANVRQYVSDKSLHYPVAIDNDFAIWNAFGVRAWPTWFLVDREGKIRFVQVGEGAYTETAKAIERLLMEK